MSKTTINLPEHYLLWNHNQGGIRRKALASKIAEISDLGKDATQEDLNRYWDCFNTILMNDCLIEALGISLDSDEKEQAIDAWIWNDGDWSAQMDLILGKIE